MRLCIRTLMPLLLLGALADAQSQLSRPRAKCPSADVLYRPVLREVWSHDEGENAYIEANGFIRIAVHPAWEPESFVDIRLNRKSAATVVLYSLPKGAKNITVLLEKELGQFPGADPKSLARMLPVKRQTLQADKKMESLITEFFNLRWEPRRIPDSVRLDATEYELEYIGDDTLVFSSDDYETPVVQWIGSFLSAVHNAEPR